MDQDIIRSLTELLINDDYLRHEIMEVMALQPGEILFHRGDPGDSLYVVNEGEIRIFTQDPQGKEITINHVRPGECLGELALIDARSRSASAIATLPTQLLRLSREDFLTQVNRSQPMTECVLRLLSERVRYMTEYVERLGLWARLIANEDYASISASLSEIDLKEDNLLIAVADSIRMMVRSIREREQHLKESLQQLQIEIDQETLQKRVEEITDTDYFQDLLQQSRQRRAKHHPKLPE